MEATLKRGPAEGMLSAPIRMIREVVYNLPQGQALPEETWQRRHGVIVLLLWLHVVGFMVAGAIAGFAALHIMAEIAGVAVLAGVAGWAKLGRQARAGAATIGLITCSALMVHISGGKVEMHFHFFVMVTVVALYQSWVPFLLALSYVVLHHGGLGVLSPTSVYNHPDAIAHPWKWAMIHAAFVLGLSTVCVITWRMNEAARAYTELTLDSVGEAVFGLDSRGRVAFVNPVASRALGWQPEKLIGRSVHSTICPGSENGGADDQAKCALCRSAIIGRFHTSSEEMFRRRSSVAMRVEYVSNPLHYRGRVAGTVVTFKDVTDQAARPQDREQVAQMHVARMEAVTVKQRFEDLAERVPGIVWEWSPASERYSFVNQRAEMLLGYPMKRWLTEPGMQAAIVHPDDRERVAAAWQAAIADGATHDIEYRVVAADERVLAVRDTVYAAHDASGQVRELRGVMTEVTGGAGTSEGTAAA